MSSTKTTKSGGVISNGRQTKRLRTPEEQRAEIERVAREHGADLSEDAFNEVLRKVGRRAPAAQ